VTARFCTECGSALEPADRFCTSCGATVRAATAAATAATPAPAAPAPAPAPVAAPAKKRGGGPGLLLPLGLGALAAVATYALLDGTLVLSAAVLIVVALVVAIVRGIVGLFVSLLFRRGLAVALVTVLVMGSCGYAANAYAQGSDLRVPSLPSEGDLRRALPFLTPTAALPAPDAELERLRTEALTAVDTAARAGSERMARIKQQLVGAGLPVRSASRLTTDKGEAVLAVGLDFERLAGQLSSTGGVSETFGSVVRIAQVKDLDLRGLQHVSVGVLDGAGRLLFSTSAPVSAIERFRAGTMKQDEFIRTMAFRGENRIAIVDAVRRLVAR
jgi:hypothetical protein